MQKNYRDRALQHLEGERTKENHGREQHPADHVAVLEKRSQLLHQCLALARRHVLQRAPQRRQQLGLVYYVRKRDHHQDQQRHYGKQRVIGHCACQKQTLIGAKRVHHLERERAGALEYLGGPRTDEIHGRCSATPL